MKCQYIWREMTFLGSEMYFWGDFMYLALCDDDKYTIDKLKKLLLDYAKKNRIAMTIDSYSNGNALVDSNINYDFILLDYLMDGMDGLQTARELRKKGVKSAIVFLTSYSTFVYDAFEVNAFRFLLKPIDEEMIYKALDDYIKMVNSKSSITIMEKGEIKKIDTEDICFIEADGKYSRIHMKDDIIRCSKTLSEVLEMLPKHYFVKTHRSYVVNFENIKNISSNKINFVNDEIAFISKTYQKTVKDKFMDYLLKSSINIL